jgi:hypothetical protein
MSDQDAKRSQYRNQWGYELATVPAYKLHPPTFTLEDLVYLHSENVSLSEIANTEGLSTKTLRARVREIKNDQLKDARMEVAMAKAEVDREKWTQVLRDLKKPSPKKTVDPLGFVEEAFYIERIPRPLPPDKQNPTLEELVNSYLAKVEVMNLVNAHVADRNLGVSQGIKLHSLLKKRGLLPTKEEKQAFLDASANATAVGATLGAQKEEADKRAKLISEMMPFDEHLVLANWGPLDWRGPQGSAPGPAPIPAPRQEPTPTPTYVAQPSLGAQLDILLDKLPWKQKQPSGSHFIYTGEVPKPVVKFMEAHGTKIGENSYQFWHNNFEFVLDGDLVRSPVWLSSNPKG